MDFAGENVPYIVKVLLKSKKRNNLHENTDVIYVLSLKAQ